MQVLFWFVIYISFLLNIYSKIIVKIVSIGIKLCKSDVV